MIEISFLIRININQYFAFRILFLCIYRTVLELSYDRHENVNEYFMIAQRKKIVEKLALDNLIFSLCHKI